MNADGEQITNGDQLSIKIAAKYKKSGKDKSF
jgi:hypothetical protein